MTQPILIAPFKTGIDTDISPWLAPPDSFSSLNNFHIRHGYIQKRSGFRIFGYMNHNRGSLITGATQANPCVITSVAHGIANGQTVLISNVNGMVELNGNTYTAANVAANTLELSGIDSIAFTLYTSGGSVAVYPAGTITGITQASPAVVTASNNFQNGDQVAISTVSGMVEVNGLIFTVASVSATSFELFQSQADSLSVTGITNANPSVVTVEDLSSLVNGDTVTVNNVVGMAGLNGGTYTVASINIDLKTFELAAAGPFGVYASGGTVSIAIDSTNFTLYTSSGLANYFTEDRIMGIFRYYDPTGAKNTLAFDTTGAAIYNGVSDRFDPLDAGPIMSGSETDYLWTLNWQHSGSTNRMYFTNGKEYDGTNLDGIRYYDSSVSATSTVSFNTNSLGGTRTLYGCKMLFAIKQRLVCLNTYERDAAAPPTKNFPQRARWCQAQGPSNWSDTVPGGGGFVDAPTGEQIISARALQDVIIVFFTNSVWTLRPVPDPALPFRWDKINDFRACDGKMATVQYDRYVVAVGVRGITATDGVETRRIDDRIQDFVSDQVNLDEFGKVYCVRDFDNNRGWTLYPHVNNKEDINDVENSKALILDEDSSAFSEYVIDMNCIGTGNYSRDFGLDDFVAANNLDEQLDFFDEETLQTFFWQDNADAFLGGDVGGVVHVLQTLGADNGTSISCELMTNAWNPYQQEGREAQLNYVDIYVEVEKNTQILVEFFKDTDIYPYIKQRSDILPPLGFIAEISNISPANPAVVTAAEHGLSDGDIIFIYGVLGTIGISEKYTITVVDDDNFSLDGIDTSSSPDYTTGGQVVRKEYYRTKSWKRILAGGIGFQHRMKISSSGTNCPLKIESFKASFRPRGRRTIN